MALRKVMLERPLVLVVSPRIWSGESQHLGFLEGAESVEVGTTTCLSRERPNHRLSTSFSGFDSVVLVW